MFQQFNYVLPLTTAISKGTQSATQFVIVREFLSNNDSPFCWGTNDSTLIRADRWLAWVESLEWPEGQRLFHVRLVAFIQQLQEEIRRANDQLYINLEA